MNPVRDNDQIWYEIYQALHASNASESSLETLRTLVLERSTIYVPCVDSTPIVIATSTADSSSLGVTNLPGLSSSETHLSIVSSNSSALIDKRERPSIFTVFIPKKSKKSKFVKAAISANTETLLDLQGQVDREAMQKALLEIVRSDSVVPGQADVVRLLLNSGAHAEYPDSFYRRTPLISAIISRRIDLIDPLLEGGAGLETRDGRRNNTPLIWAVYTNDQAILRQLIRKGADMIVKDRISGRTPLILAIYQGHIDASRVILEEDGRFINEKDEHGLTPLAIAYTMRHVTLANLCLQFEDDKDFVSPSGSSLLSLAIMENQTDFVRLLVENDARITQVNGMPALTAAVKQQASLSVKILIEKIPAEDRGTLETRDSRGGTALLWAVWLKNEHIVEMLVAAGANTSVKDSDGVSVQYWARWTKNKRILALVTQNGGSGYVQKVELPG
jgi:ankyrin repeat protein